MKAPESLELCDCKSFSEAFFQTFPYPEPLCLNSVTHWTEPEQNTWRTADKLPLAPEGDTVSKFKDHHVPLEESTQLPALSSKGRRNARAPGFRAPDQSHCCPEKWSLYQTLCLPWCSRSPAEKKKRKCIKIKTSEIPPWTRPPLREEGGSWLTEEFQPGSAQRNPFKLSHL